MGSDNEFVYPDIVPRGIIVHSHSPAAWHCNRDCYVTHTIPTSPLTRSQVSDDAFKEDWDDV